MENLADIKDISNSFRDDLEGKYWYISTIVPATGRLVVLGEYPSEDEAEKIAFQRFNGTYKVFSMPTKDRAKATQHAKYEMFHEGAALEQAVRRAKHKI